MAIISSLFPFLDACDRLGAIRSPLFALGSLEYPDADAIGDEAVRGRTTWRPGGVYVVGRAPAGSPWPGSDVAALLRDRYGVDDYVDFDLNADARVNADLSAPLPDEWRGRAGMVLEAGTLEHIFDFPRAIENIHAMLAPGGSLVGIAPVTFWGHGYVNFNPKFFREVALANGYEPLVEGFWFRARLPPFGRRKIVVLTRERELRPRAQLWVDRLMNRVQPANVQYLFCFRKTVDAPFRRPADVFDNWATQGEAELTARP